VIRAPPMWVQRLLSYSLVVDLRLEQRRGQRSLSALSASRSPPAQARLWPGPHRRPPRVWKPRLSHYVTWLVPNERRGGHNRAPRRAKSSLGRGPHLGCQSHKTSRVESSMEGVAQRFFPGPGPGRAGAPRLYGPLLLRSSAGAEQLRGGRDATSSLVTTGSSLGITCVEGTSCRNHHTTRLVMLLVPRSSGEGVMPLPGPSRTKPGSGSGRGPTYAGAAAAIRLERCRVSDSMARRRSPPAKPGSGLDSTGVVAAAKGPLLWRSSADAYYQQQRKGCNAAPRQAKPDSGPGPMHLGAADIILFGWYRGAEGRALRLFPSGEARLGQGPRECGCPSHHPILLVQMPSSRGA